MAERGGVTQQETTSIWGQVPAEKSGKHTRVGHQWRRNSETYLAKPTACHTHSQTQKELSHKHSTLVLKPCNHIVPKTKSRKTVFLMIFPHCPKTGPRPDQDKQVTCLFGLDSDFIRSRMVSGHCLLHQALNTTKKHSNTRTVLDESTKMCRCPRLKTHWGPVHQHNSFLSKALTCRVQPSFLAY